MPAAFGLTPAETRVLTCLLVGRTLAETATTLGIAVATAKTHLEHIFSKTGVTRQADLMPLWARLVSPTGRAKMGRLISPVCEVVLRWLGSAWPFA